MTTTEIHVTYTCSHCEHAVSSEVSQIPGVDLVEVSAATRPAGPHQQRAVC